MQSEKFFSTFYLDPQPNPAKNKKNNALVKKKKVFRWSTNHKL